MQKQQLEELLYQALETEIGGQKVYEAAIRCAQNSELKEEWQKYLDETRTHEVISSVALAHGGKEEVRTDITKVTFRACDEATLRAGKECVAISVAISIVYDRSLLSDWKDSHSARCSCSTV